MRRCFERGGGREGQRERDRKYWDEERGRVSSWWGGVYRS